MEQSRIQAMHAAASKSLKYSFLPTSHIFDFPLKYWNFGDLIKFQLIRGIILTTYAQKRRYSSFWLLFWQRHWIQRPRFPIHVEHFDDRKTLTAFFGHYSGFLVNAHHFYFQSKICCYRRSRRHRFPTKVRIFWRFDNVLVDFCLYFTAPAQKRQFPSFRLQFLQLRWIQRPRIRLIVGYFGNQNTISVLFYSKSDIFLFPVYLTQFLKKWVLLYRRR